MSPLREVQQAVRTIMTFSEREKGEVKCPKCQGTKFAPQVSEFVAQMGKKADQSEYQRFCMGSPIAFGTSTGRRP